MNDVTKEKTVPYTSVAADEGQSNQNLDNSITEYNEFFKDYYEVLSAT